MCLIFVNARKASHPQVKLLSPRSFIKQQVFWINKMNFKSNIKTFLFRSYCCTSCYSNVIYEIKMTTVANILPLFILFYAWSSMVIFLSQQKVASTSYRFSKLFFLHSVKKKSKRVYPQPSHESPYVKKFKIWNKSPKVWALNKFYEESYL